MTTYKTSYINSGGKIEQIIVTDTNDTNCNFLSRTATNRDLDPVDVDSFEQTKLTSQSKTVCLLNNPTAAEPTCVEWTVSAADKVNAYLEMPSGEDLLEDDADMKCYASVYHNGRYYHLDNALPRDTYSCDRVSTPNRINFASGVLREGLKAILVIMPN